ncbi:GNAT family N-acetyltransferase [Massilibacteroides sp.]|uniref:GNAT family N-acetyltransferase n=1 Tax=Massilibacteroides sp. TaxID=2034766 RepID=UPI00262ACAF0|nr:GNAT family N-acetyltransferase [Massilibacteroides sp.]MDD4514228.1 GNAT family N-acetyltransferase [Massilibacteroides sp.]
MEHVIFRIARQEDLVKIVDIYNSTIPSRIVTADTEPVSVESRQGWFEAHQPEKHPLWVMENDENEIIGWASYQPFYGRPAYAATAEISIYLAESARGKGLGKQTLLFCIEKAPEYGIKTLLGFIFEHNKSSMTLFENSGFTLWGKLPRIALLDGQEYNLCILGKRLL